MKAMSLPCKTEMNLPRLRNKENVKWPKRKADREMKLAHQLAVEKQRAAILQKENEIQKLKFEIVQKTFEKEIRRKVSEETQQVPKFQQHVVTTSNFSHSAVQSDSVQSTSTLTSPHAQPSTSVRVSPVTQINSSSLSAVTEPKTIFDQTPLDLYADLNLALNRPMGTTKINMNVVSATQTAPTVLPIETSGYVSRPETSSTTLVDLTNFEISTISATSISAAEVFTSALPNSSGSPINDFRKQRYSANCSVNGEGTSCCGQTVRAGETIQWY